MNTSIVSAAECSWEAINAFDGWAEFTRFEAWLDDQVGAGEALPVAVAEAYHPTLAFEERWIQHAASGQIWRLVKPEPPFAGVFRRVSA